jgi:hypothetical protein
MSSSKSRLPQDLAFDLLSSRRRRLALYYLKRHSDGTTVIELAEQIAAVENETDVESLTKQQQKRVYISLYQTHIPKLAEAGVIDHDEDTGEVTLTNLARDLDVYLTPEGEQRYPWHFHYLVLAAVSAVLFLLNAAGLPVFDGLPMPIPGALVIVAFAVSALVHYLHRQSYHDRLLCELSETSF